MRLMVEDKSGKGFVEVVRQERKNHDKGQRGLTSFVCGSGAYEEWVSSWMSFIHQVKRQR